MQEIIHCLIHCPFGCLPDSPNCHWHVKDKKDCPQLCKACGENIINSGEICQHCSEVEEGWQEYMKGGK